MLLAKRGFGEVNATASFDMISVTRLNGKQMVINAELIRTVESNPDTTITLVNGDHIIVKEPVEQVVRLSVEYGRSLRTLLSPT